MGEKTRVHYKIQVSYGKEQTDDPDYYDGEWYDQFSASYGQRDIEDAMDDLASLEQQLKDRTLGIRRGRSHVSQIKLTPDNIEEAVERLRRIHNQKFPEPQPEENYERPEYPKYRIVKKTITEKWEVVSGHGNEAEGVTDSHEVNQRSQDAEASGAGVEGVGVGQQDSEQTVASGSAEN